MVVYIMIQVNNEQWTKKELTDSYILFKTQTEKKALIHVTKAWSSRFEFEQIASEGKLLFTGNFIETRDISNYDTVEIFTEKADAPKLS